MVIDITSPAVLYDNVEDIHSYSKTYNIEHDIDLYVKSSDSVDEIDLSLNFIANNVTATVVVWCDMRITNLTISYTRTHGLNLELYIASKTAGTCTTKLTVDGVGDNTSEIIKCNTLVNSRSEAYIDTQVNIEGTSSVIDLQIESIIAGDNNSNAHVRPNLFIKSPSATVKHGCVTHTYDDACEHYLQTRGLGVAQIKSLLTDAFFLDFMLAKGNIMDKFLKGKRHA